MTCNLGGVERTIRVVLGAVLLAVGFFGELPTWGAAVALAVGAVALVTGAIGFCAAWLLFGINTCPTKASGKA